MYCTVALLASSVHVHVLCMPWNDWLVSLKTVLLTLSFLALATSLNMCGVKWETEKVLMCSDKYNVISGMPIIRRHCVSFDAIHPCTLLTLEPCTPQSSDYNNRYACGVSTYVLPFIIKVRCVAPRNLEVICCLVGPEQPVRSAKDFNIQCLMTQDLSWPV